MPTAMITGAAGGLGSAIADALAPTHTLFLAGRPTPQLDADGTLQRTVAEAGAAATNSAAAATEASARPSDLR